MLCKAKKKILIFSSAAAVVLAAGIVILMLALRKPVVAMYGLKEKQKSALMQLKVFFDNKGKAKFKFIELDAEQPLEAQLKKCHADLLFAFQSAELERIAAPLLDSKNIKLGIDKNILAPYTDTVSAVAGISKAERVVKIPLASDFVSFAFDSNFINNFGLEGFNSLGDVERYLRRSKDYVRTPMVFAGAEFGFALDLAGVFCEAVDGAENYRKAVLLCNEYCKSGKRDAAELAKTLCEDEENSPFYNAMKTLKGWYKKEYFTKDAFSMKYSDVYEFMRAQNAPLAILSLSARRAAPREYVKRYISTYVPSDHYGTRMFYAPTLCVLCCSKNKDSVDAAARLALSEMQEIFSLQSGLAPVLAACKTADVQADDVRYWVAASAAPLAGLCADAFTDAAFAAEVSALIGQMIVN